MVPMRPAMTPIHPHYSILLFKSFGCDLSGGWNGQYSELSMCKWVSLVHSYLSTNINDWVVGWTPPLVWEFEDCPVFIACRTLVGGVFHNYGFVTCKSWISFQMATPLMSSERLTRVQATTALWLCLIPPQHHSQRSTRRARALCSYHQTTPTSAPVRHRLSQVTSAAIVPRHQSSTAVAATAPLKFRQSTSTSLALVPP